MQRPVRKRLRLLAGLDRTLSDARNEGVCDEIAVTPDAFKCASVEAGPWHDTCALPRGSGEIVPRMGGDTYTVCGPTRSRRTRRGSFATAGPLLRPARSCPPAGEYGKKYVEATRAGTKKFDGEKDYDAQFLRYSVPGLVARQAVRDGRACYQEYRQEAVDRTRMGSRSATDGIAAADSYSESKVRRPFDADVAPGETVTVDIGIATVTASRQPDSRWRLPTALRNGKKFRRQMAVRAGRHGPVGADYHGQAQRLGGHLPDLQRAEYAGLQPPLHDDRSRAKRRHRDLAER